jgi:hypothetical protein
MPTPSRQLESLTSYPADGVQTAWNFTFSGGYLDQAHVKAYSLSPLGVRTDIPVTSGMFSGTYQLTITPAVAAGYELTIYRDTPTAAPMVDFTDKAQLTEVDLDTTIKQAVFSAAESQDALSIVSDYLATAGTYTDSALASKNAAAASAAAALASQTAAATSETNAAASASAAAASAASVVDTNLVHKASAETITGVKTFSAAPILNAGATFNTVAPAFNVQPTGLVKATVGLGNVDNTSDVNKPVSTAQATAIAAVPTFKNKVRNPFMDIAQRGATITSPANGTYTLDGWVWINTSAGVVTVTQQADAPVGAEYDRSLRITVTTADAAVAAGDVASINQPIEGYLVRDLQGNPVAIRFDVKSAKTGTHCVAIRNSGLDRSYILTYTVNAANTWENKTLALPGGLITAGTWNWSTGNGMFITFALMAGTTFQAAAAGAWQVGNFYATAAQVNVLDTVGNVFAISGVQVERGSVSSVLEHRDPVTELHLNQRYLPAFNAVTGADDAAWGGTTTTSTATVDYQFLVEPRAAITGIVTNSVANFQLTTMSVASTVTGITFASSGKRMCRMQATGTGTPYAANNPAILLGQVAGAQIIFTGAEL